jgi:hypothetical protein
LREHHDEIVALGGAVVAVAGAAPHQARHLMETGVPFPCLLDPDHRLFEVLDLRRMPWRAWLWPRTYTNYLRAAGRERPGRVSWKNALQRPGVVVLDGEGRLGWVHRGRTLGDYPAVAEVISQVAQLVARGLPRPGSEALDR